MIDLDDIRQDIFDIKTVPKVLYVYRGDTFEVDLDLTISSSELNTVVLNCEGLPEATPLTLLESTTVSSKWHLVLNKTQTLILAPKTHNFTITIVRTDGTELTLYKGIMAVNNRVYSNYSNNYYIATLLKQTVPTISDNDYLIGTMWVNVLTNRVYFLTSVVNDEANWLDYSDQLDNLHIRIEQVLDGTLAFAGQITELETTRELLANKAEDFTVINQTKYPTVEATKNELDKKVDKILTIIGLDLQDNILIDEFRTALGNATQIFAGLMSPEDKTHLDGLMELFDGDADSVVNTIAEVLAIFNNYPEGADLVTTLATKVDKVSGKQLSTNDLTNVLKDYYDTAYAHSQIVGANPHQMTYAQLLNKPTTIEQAGILNVYNKEYIDTLKDKNGWESALLGTLSNNGTIDLSVINQYDEIQMYAKDALGVIDNENIRPSLMQSGDSVYFFDDTQAYITVDTLFNFYAPAGYTLQVVGLKYTELVASDIGTDEVGVTVQDKLNLIASDLTDTISEVNDIDFKVRTNELKTTQLEESVRKVEAGDTKAIVSDTEVINLPLNTANGQLKLTLNGMILQAKQLVTNGDFSDGTTWWNNYTATQTVTNGINIVKATAKNGRVLSTVTRVTGVQYLLAVRHKTDSVDVGASVNDIPLFDYGFPKHSGNNNFEALSQITTGNTGIVGYGIIDKRTSGWTNFEVDYVYLFNITNLKSNKQYSPLYQTTFDLMSDADIKTQMDLWVADGTLPNDNVQAVNGNKRVTSIGKNLFEGELELGGIGYSTGVNEVYTTRSRTAGFIRVKPNVTYTLKSSLATNDMNMYEYDIDKVFIKATNFSTAYTGKTQTMTLNTYYIRFQNASAVDLTAQYQLELGSVATTYEPYKSTEMYVNAPKLYSLPNGVKDTIEFKNGKAYIVPRIKKYMLQESDIISLGILTNIEYLLVKKPLDFINYNIDVSTTNSIRYLDFIDVHASGDDIANANKISSHNATLLRFWMLKDTYTTIEEAKTALAGTVMYYQLATPIETEIPASGNLLGHSKGTVYIENVVADVDVYTTKIDITNTDLPIKRLEKIAILNDNGTETLLDVATAVINVDKLSFTHPDLTANDKVYFIYEYEDNNNVFGITDIEYFNSNNVIIDSVTGKVYRIVNNVASGILSQSLEEVL